MRHRDYEDKIVSSFENQIQSEYYGSNKSVSIECTELYNLISPQ